MHSISIFLQELCWEEDFIRETFDRYWDEDDDFETFFLYSVLKCLIHDVDEDDLSEDDLELGPDLSPHTFKQVLERWWEQRDLASLFAGLNEDTLEIRERICH